MSKLIRALVLCATLALCSSNALALGPTTYPDGSINFGVDGATFSVLSEGDITSVDNTFTGPSYVKGNVGVGGQGNFSMSDGSIDGDFYMNDYGTLTLSGPARINGTKRGLHQNGVSQQSKLTNSINDFNNLATMAANEINTGSYSVTQGTFNGTTVNTGQSVTLVGTGKVVLNLQDFVMTSGTFTLQGTTATTFIINVSRNFSLNNSSVVLAGGLMTSHVLFNVKGSGSQVSLNQGTNLWGNLLAMDRKVALSGGRIHGRLGAKQIAITSGGQVVSE